MVDGVEGPECPGGSEGLVHVIGVHCDTIVFVMIEFVLLALLRIPCQHGHFEQPSWQVGESLHLHTTRLPVPRPWMEPRG